MYIVLCVPESGHCCPLPSHMCLVSSGLWTEQRDLGLELFLQWCCLCLCTWPRVLFRSRALHVRAGLGCLLPESCFVIFSAFSSVASYAPWPSPVFSGCVHPAALHAPGTLWGGLGGPEQMFDFSLLWFCAAASAVRPCRVIVARIQGVITCTQTQVYSIGSLPQPKEIFLFSGWKKNQTMPDGIHQFSSFVMGNKAA